MERPGRKGRCRLQGGHQEVPAALPKPRQLLQLHSRFIPFSHFSSTAPALPGALGAVITCAVLLLGGAGNIPECLKSQSLEELDDPPEFAAVPESSTEGFSWEHCQDQLEQECQDLGILGCQGDREPSLPPIPESCSPAWQEWETKPPDASQQLQQLLPPVGDAAFRGNLSISLCQGSCLLHEERNQSCSQLSGTGGGGGEGDEGILQGAMETPGRGTGKRRVETPPFQGKGFTRLRFHTAST